SSSWPRKAQRSRAFHRKIRVRQHMETKLRFPRDKSHVILAIQITPTCRVKISYQHQTHPSAPSSLYEEHMLKKISVTAAVIALGLSTLSGCSSGKLSTEETCALLVDKATELSLAEKTESS